MIAILLLIGLGTVFFLGLFAGIRYQDGRRELLHRRRIANMRARGWTARAL